MLLTDCSCGSFQKLYLFSVKGPIILALCLASVVSHAQFSLRSDIVLGKHTKAKSIGLSLITVSLGRTRMPGGTYERNTLMIDVGALRNPGRYYSYRQIAERVYGLTPGIPAGHLNQPWVPYFLVAEPPLITRRPVPAVNVRR